MDVGDRIQAPIIAIQPEMYAVGCHEAHIAVVFDELCNFLHFSFSVGWRRGRFLVAICRAGGHVM